MLTSSKPTDNLQDLVRRQAQLIEQQGAQIALLQEQLSWLKRQLFGAKSERIVADLGQQSLPFAEAETAAAPVFCRQTGKPVAGGGRFPLQPYLAGCVYLGLGAAALTGLRKP